MAGASGADGDTDAATPPVCQACRNGQALPQLQRPLSQSLHCSFFLSVFPFGLLEELEAERLEGVRLPGDCRPRACGEEDRDATAYGSLPISLYARSLFFLSSTCSGVSGWCK